MKIDFFHVGEKAECKVTIDVPHCGKVTWKFLHQHIDQYYAGFVVRAMNDQMRDAIEKMRRESYEEGWAAAKAKKGGKETWFGRFWSE